MNLNKLEGISLNRLDLSTRMTYFLEKDAESEPCFSYYNNGTCIEHQTILYLLGWTHYSPANYYPFEIPYNL